MGRPQPVSGMYKRPSPAYSYAATQTTILVSLKRPSCHVASGHGLPAIAFPTVMHHTQVDDAILQTSTPKKSKRAQAAATHPEATVVQTDMPEVGEDVAAMITGAVARRGLSVTSRAASVSMVGLACLPLPAVCVCFIDSARAFGSMPCVCMHTSMHHPLHIVLRISPHRYTRLTHTLTPLSCTCWSHTGPC
jgi:hypothetical protein